MAGKYISASIDPPRRVQVLKADSAGGYWKPGQFGYAISYSTHPGMHTLDRGPTEAGELAYLVAKSKDMRGGALWFSAKGLRFTGSVEAPHPVHARKKKKLTPQEAKRLLESEGVDFSRGYYESISTSEGERIAEVARMAGYRKSKNAPGSTGRMYYEYLSRLKTGRAHAQKKGEARHTVYDLVEVDTRTKKERVLHEHFSTRAHAQEAADEYKTMKRQGVSYRIRSREVAEPPYRWNPED